MKKYPLVFGIVTLFILSAFVPMSFGYNIKISNVNEQLSILSRGKILYVGGGGEGNYSSIQDAIDNASDGDTVFVYDDSSPYYESVDVYKSINLIGEDRDRTVIDGGYSGDVVSISVDWVYISGFTIQNSGLVWDDAGVDILSNYNTITGNTISNNRHGIGLYGDRNTITGNTISLNNDEGIYLFGDSNTITGNTISLNNRDGIELYGHSNTITGNTISLNNRDGIELYRSDSNTITDNSISYNGNGIWLYISRSNTITGNTISLNNDDGVELSKSNRNTITDNNIISNNRHGIGLYGDRNTITGNTISLNKENGIFLHGSSNNTIKGNIISNNGLGIELYESSGNIIFKNNFINNGENAYDECDNIWDDGKYGNYWSDYKEKYPDAKKKWWKGIWDTPYEIPGGDNTDRCPLIKQWPYSKPRTISRNTTSYSSYLLRFLERFPLLNYFMSLLTY